MTSKQEHSNYNGKHSREVSMIDSVLTDETPYTSTMHDDHDPNDIAGNETSKGERGCYLRSLASRELFLVALFAPPQTLVTVAHIGAAHIAH